MPSFPVTVIFTPGQGISVSVDPVPVPFSTNATISWTVQGPGASWGSNGIEFEQAWLDAGFPQAQLSGDTYSVTYTNKTAGRFKYDVNLNVGSLDPEVENEPPIFEEDKP